MRAIVATGLAGALAAASVVTTAGPAPAAAPNAHVAWCAQNYRSYNQATDAFTGYDGFAHTCVSPDQAATRRTFGLGIAASSPAGQRASGGRYSVFPDESSPGYGTPAEADTPQSGG